LLLPEEKIVLYVGRLVYEKGIHVLINAVPKSLQKVDAKIHNCRKWLHERAVAKHCFAAWGLIIKSLFEGFVDEESLL